MTWTRIQNGRSVELTDIDPSGRFHPDILWLEVPPELETLVFEQSVGDVGGALGVVDLQLFKESLKLKVQDRRWVQSLRGVEHDGHRFQTDAEARGNIVSSLKLAELYEAVFGAGAYNAKWQAMDGFVDLTLPALTAVGMAVGAYVQACFDRQSELWGLIDAAETWQEALAVFTVGAEQGWPGE